MFYTYGDKTPQIAQSAYIADYVTITGDVKVGEEANIWFNTVIRGDVAPTLIGQRVNIQDQCVLHQSPKYPLILEDDVSIGHKVLLHSCTIRKNALIGMGAQVLDGVEIGEGAFVGAGSLIPPGKTIPPRTLVFGQPAKVIRELTEDDIEEMQRIREVYVERGQYYKNLQETQQQLSREDVTPKEG
ncbi:gamma carbonic anhydrase family protein [Salsuginibacillus kocurii]|uniref:gamma carbonic anhydrase n=1 Tax=Salsuginibacillus kocurii TaxID=427078 RepID=UPI00037F2DF9|nr:gamma carbonic anhydrase family protein [Salsuginibacillus kocurii]